MWVLESDGDVLQVKRVWLRPGRTYLFGRTKKVLGKYGGVAISHKSVSRKHLTLSVSQVTPGDGSLVHKRSELTLEDAKTKIGTEINGERVRGEKRVLKGDTNSFRLGSFEQMFTIKWHPIVLSFTFAGKEFKGQKDPLITVRSRLEELDIKTIIPYNIGKTTHVVASKRNTAKGLQALINGKFIVTDAFINALVVETTCGNLDEPESLSALEEDFDGKWPNALQYLPPPSKDPDQPPVEVFMPDTHRIDVFAGYTFVFCEQKQFESLQPPIANGGGKALHFAVTPGETTAEDVVRYIKSVAGEKGLGEFEDHSEGRGVVAVKFRAPGFEDWAVNVQTEVALALDQRLIEQNEFLDAILTNDASRLRKVLEEADDETMTTTQLPDGSLRNRNRTLSQNNTLTSEPPSTQPEDSEPPKRRIRPRGTVVSQFHDVDVDFEPIASSTPRPNLNGSFPSKNSTQPSQQNSRAVSFADSPLEDVSSDEVHGHVSHIKNPRKRPPPSNDDDDEDGVDEAMLPAAAAMKRRKIEEEMEARRRGVSLEVPVNQPEQGVDSQAKKRKARKEMNIQDAVRERREAADEAARLDELALREANDDLNVDELKNLVIIEEMEVKERTNRPPRILVNGEASERWDERWNGRKNFKRFRRRGDGNLIRRGPSVMVPLEEVKKKDYGIGEEYWLGSSKSVKKRKEKENAEPSQSQLFPNPRSQPEEVPSQLTVGGQSEVVDVKALRKTRLMDKTNASQQSTMQSSSLNGKRAASTTCRGAAAAKKQKMLAMDDSDSDSEDDLKFKFTSRGKAL